MLECIGYVPCRVECLQKTIESLNLKNICIKQCSCSYNRYGSCLSEICYREISHDWDNVQWVIFSAMTKNEKIEDVFNLTQW